MEQPGHDPPTAMTMQCHPLSTGWARAPRRSAQACDVDRQTPARCDLPTASTQWPPQSGGANTISQPPPAGPQGPGVAHKRTTSITQYAPTANQRQCAAITAGVCSSPQYPINGPNGPGVVYRHPTPVARSISSALAFMYPYSYYPSFQLCYCIQVHFGMSEA